MSDPLNNPPDYTNPLGVMFWLEPSLSGYATKLGLQPTSCWVVKQEAGPDRIEHATIAVVRPNSSGAPGRILFAHPSRDHVAIFLDGMAFEMRKSKGKDA